MEHYPFSLKPLPYDYDALEPFIDQHTLHLHHDQHLKTYVDRLNQALEPYSQYHDCPLEWLLKNFEQLPCPLRIAVRNNGGGVYNHNLYFASMSPQAPAMPHKMTALLCRDFGSVSAFKEAFKQAALNQFGSGYAWLVCNLQGKLCIRQTSNQDTPLLFGDCPLMTVDVWEHAYYLQYQNRRSEYLDQWFQLIHWPLVLLRLETALNG